MGRKMMGSPYELRMADLAVSGIDTMIKKNVEVN